MDDGVVALEFAIVAPIVLLLIFATIDFGRAYYVKQSMLTAASQGARMYALGSSDSATVQTTVRTMVPQVQDVASGGSALTLSAPTGSCPASGATATDSRTVTASIAFKWWTPFTWFAAPGENSSTRKSTISATASWLCINKT